MKTALVVLLSVLVLALGSSALTNPIAEECPFAGTFHSMDQGGVMLSGRFSESWVGAGGAGQLGNTVNAMSWDGAILGSEWYLRCTFIGAPPTLISDHRVDGTGFVTYETSYTGGTFWLSKDGPWTNGGGLDFPGMVGSFISTSTHEYLSGSLIGVRSNVVMWGQFRDCDGCLDLAISNASMVSTTDFQAKPADYPEFLDDSCLPANRGAWGTVPSVTLVIHGGGCTVPIEPSTWGKVKALFASGQ